MAQAIASVPRKVGRPTLSDEELLDIALDLFLERGFEGTSLEAIASTAGMAKRTIYARYADKEALFRAALSRAIEEWIVPVAELEALEAADFPASLRAIGRRLVSNILNPAGLRLYRLTNSIAGRMPDLAIHNVEQGTKPTVAYLASLFARRVDFATARPFDPEQAAMAFLNLVVGGPSSMAAWGLEFDDAALDAHVESSVALFLEGLLPRTVDGAELVEENARLRRLLTDALLEKQQLRDAAQG